MLFAQIGSRLCDIEVDKAKTMLSDSEPEWLDQYNKLVVIGKGNNEYRFCVLLSDLTLGRANSELVEFLLLAAPYFSCADLAVLLSDAGVRTGDGKELKANNVSGLCRWL